MYFVSYNRFEWIHGTEQRTVQGNAIVRLHPLEWVKEMNKGLGDTTVVLWYKALTSEEQSLTDFLPSSWEN